MYCRSCKNQNADHVTSDHHKYLAAKALNEVFAKADDPRRKIQPAANPPDSVPAVVAKEAVKSAVDCPVCAARRQKDRERKQKRRAKA